MLLLQTRIFASHYQFYIHDSEYEHYDDVRLNWSEGEKLEYGYMATEHAIYISTKSDLNDHRVRIYLGRPENVTVYETCFFHNLEIPSGILQLSSPSGEYEDDVVVLEKRKYNVSILGKCVGKDMFSYEEQFNEEMTDQEYFNFELFEIYDIYIENA